MLAMISLEMKMAWAVWAVLGLEIKVVLLEYKYK
jgi:hypothetical protein